MIDTFSTIATYNRFSVTASGGTLVSYDTTIAIDARQGDICEPAIYGITSAKYGNNISAGGIGDEITLVGDHFGNSNGRLYLPNADMGSDTSNYMPIQDYDLISWSDTMIKFTLANLADSMSMTGARYNIGTYGSGYPKVKNKWKAQNYLTTTTPRINILYSLIQRSAYSGANYYKANTYLWSSEPGGGYTFYLHPSITNQDMKDCILSAIEYWRCATGVDFRVGTSPISWSESVQRNGRSIIILDSTTVYNDSALIETYRFDEKVCSTSFTLNKPFPVTEVDIAINQKLYSLFEFDASGLFDIPSGKYDFYESILHELGHAVGFGHVIEPLDLLYAFAKYDSTTPISYLDRVIHLESPQIEGSDSILVHSTDLASYNFNCNNFSIYNMTRQPIGDSCGPPVLNIINPHNTEELTLDIYPNPFENIINVILKEPVKDAKYYIYDTQGRLLEHGKLIDTTNLIDLSNCNFTNAILTIKNNEKWTSRVILKR